MDTFSDVLDSAANIWFRAFKLIKLSSLGIPDAFFVSPEFLLDAAKLVCLENSQPADVEGTPDAEPESAAVYELNINLTFEASLVMPDLENVAPGLRFCLCLGTVTEFSVDGSY